MKVPVARLACRSHHLDRSWASRCLAVAAEGIGWVDKRLEGVAEGKFPEGGFAVGADPAPCLEACQEEFGPFVACCCLAAFVGFVRTRGQSFAADRGRLECLDWVAAWVEVVEQSRWKRKRPVGHRIRDRTCCPPVSERRRNCSSWSPPSLWLLRPPFLKGCDPNSTNTPVLHSCLVASSSQIIHIFMSQAEPPPIGGKRRCRCW